MNVEQKCRQISELLTRVQDSGEAAQTRAHALRYEDFLRAKYRDDPEFLSWNPDRSRNTQDFEYLFFHRDRFDDSIPTHLEIIATKITYVKANGEDGYFKKLQQNVGWTRHITPLVMAQVRGVDKLVRCGLWSNAKNSRRCHQPECPYCHWNDALKVAMQAFGPNSGTFERMQIAGLTPFFITQGYTTNPKNSKAVGRDFSKKDISHSRGEPHYDPYPVRLGISENDTSDPSGGYFDANVLAVVALEAMQSVYREYLFTGYRFKLEGAFKLNPGKASRANMHAHSVANGHESDPEKVATDLANEMRRGLLQFREYLSRDYYPNVLVLRLNSAQELESAITYSDKVLPFGLIVEDAMNRPEAKLMDGSWDSRYIDEVETALLRFVGDDIPAIFGGSGHPMLRNLRRRKSVGNMTFNDRGTCIGEEPKWHKQFRRKRALEQKEKRRESKKALNEAFLQETESGLYRTRKIQNTVTKKESTKKPGSIPVAENSVMEATPAAANSNHWLTGKFEVALARQLIEFWHVTNAPPSGPGTTLRCQRFESRQDFEDEDVTYRYSKHRRILMLIIEFLTTALDLAEPFEVKDGKEERQQLIRNALEAYIDAVEHLESEQAMLVSSLALDRNDSS